MCFSTSPFRIALAAWVARYPPSFIERQPLRGFSIALVGVAVDIGESLSVPGSGSVEFSMPLTASVPCTPHRAPSDVATGGSRHAATIEVVHTRAAGLVDCRMPSG